ncbi:MAG TPA: hypothetical protein PLV81_13850 [Spirochaetota bacterium]|nr:hypothetical protein [Spirochaetota bacterium]
MKVDVTKDELYSMIKEAVREVISEKQLHIILHSLPYISDDEMRQIYEQYGSPEQYSDVAFSEKIDI